MQKVLPLIVGIIFIGVGIFMYISNNNLVKKCTEEVEAVVVDMKEDFSSDDDGDIYTYYPIIEYRVDEETIKSTMSKGSSNPEYKLGDKVTILYNPNNTKEFIIKGDKSSGIFSFVFMGLGVLVTVFGVITLFRKEKVVTEVSSNM